ncbi:signal peptidase [Barnesiella viscericola DSM 18177]|uniref:Signal peptidase n=1 Tax=Barnesiella viscericola DSM 18177 TaxID=880074 RepID=W0ER36_9BACT|nr:signal peptide peptidase SppA [Barnesiella viscericola]AHF12023.1 signal peptidase [Barnesiella viscericola DSM 18177]
MKKFFTTTFACVLGVMIAIVLLSILSVVALTGMVATTETEYVAQPHTILKLDLGTVTERSQEDVMGLLMGNQEKSDGLDNILKAIATAKTSRHIDGIYIDAHGMNMGIATLDRIHRALIDFKESGKFVYAYADTYSQREYLLSAAADSVMLNPVGAVDFRGLAGQVMFWKGLYDKLGIEMQILKVGTYKSAVEPYVNTRMSDANREQTIAYMTPIWNHLLEQLSKDRNLSVEQLNNLADTLLITVEAKELVNRGLIDSLLYRPQMEQFLKDKVGIDSDDDLIFASANEVASMKQPKNKAKDEIAIVYAEGGIDLGETNGVNTAELVEDLTKIQKDKKIKAVVLRVNSPGGSAYGSEQVWAAIEAIKAAGKPVVVSMGDVAASGGYYISCNADRIFANPTTLTGSIGIYGMIPNFEGLVTDKLGITFDGVQTNRYGNFGSFNRAMTPDEHRQMQQYIERGYELFTTRCAEGRGMSLDAIKKIAEGRVWDGQTALKIGLVDELGDLDDAIAWVAQKAGLEQYKTSSYPQQKTAVEQLFEELNKNVQARIAAVYLGESYKYLQTLEQCKNLDPLQCRMEEIELY